MLVCFLNAYIMTLEMECKLYFCASQADFSSEQIYYSCVSSQREKALSLHCASLNAQEANRGRPIVWHVVNERTVELEVKLCLNSCPLPPAARMTCLSLCPSSGVELW